MKTKMNSAIVKSKNGIHVSIYLSKNDSRDVREKLTSALDEAARLLNGKMDYFEIKEFLAPISRLDNLAFRGSLAVFFKKNYLDIIQLPIDVEPLCVVSTTFHVKPILEWLQKEQDFLLIHIGESRISAYEGNSQRVRLLEEFINARSENLLHWISDWNYLSNYQKNKRVFISGDQAAAYQLKESLDFDGKITVLKTFKSEQISSIQQKISSIFMTEFTNKSLRALSEFYQAEASGLGIRNIVEIAKVATVGNIRKLILADDIRIFGTINEFTGHLTINDQQENHLDDDIFDDLAQMVIRQGGEVILANRETLPENVVAMAITERPPRTLNLSNYFNLNVVN